jgi:hypothetical protein
MNGASVSPGVTLVPLSPSADAYVRDGPDEGTNYGASPQLRVKDAGVGYGRESLLRFDLSSVPRAPERATLILECQTSDGGGDIADLRVHAVADDTWTEASVTWLNRPAPGAFLSRAQTEAPPALVTLDVSEHVRAEYGGDGIVSLALLQQQDENGLLAVCSSREGSAPPTLEVELSPALTHPVISVTGDASDPGTTPEATVDGDLDTRWANEDHGGSITWDLGSAQSVGGIGLAWFQGSERVSFFEVRTSVDGVIWVTVDAGISRGRGEQMEYRTWDTAETARYVRYVGFGNSDSTWNSITEAVILAP